MSGGGGAAQAIASHFQLLGRNQVQHQWKVSLMGGLSMCSSCHYVSIYDYNKGGLGYFSLYMTKGKGLVGLSSARVHHCYVINS